MVMVMMTLVTLEVAAWWSLHDLRIALTLISLRAHSQVWQISPLHNQARQCHHHQPSTSLSSSTKHVSIVTIILMNINLSLYFQHQVWQTSYLLNHVLHVDVTEKLKSSLSTNSKSIWYWISSKLADSLIASLMVFQITHEIKFNLTCE